MTDRPSADRAGQPADLSSLRSSTDQMWSTLDQAKALGLHGALVASDKRVDSSDHGQTMRTEIRAVPARDAVYGGFIRKGLSSVTTLVPTDSNLKGPLSHVVETSLDASAESRRVRVDLWSGRQNPSGYSTKAARVIDGMTDDADRVVVDHALKRAIALEPTELVVATRDVRMATMVAHRDSMGVVGGQLAARVFSGENIDATLAEAGIVNPNASAQARIGAARGLSGLVRELAGSMENPAFIVVDGEIRYNRTDPADIERINQYLEVIPAGRLLDISLSVGPRNGAIPVRPGHRLIREGLIELEYVSGATRSTSTPADLAERRARAKEMFAPGPAEERVAPVVGVPVEAAPPATDTSSPLVVPAPEPIAVSFKDIDLDDPDAIFRPPADARPPIRPIVVDMADLSDVPPFDGDDAEILIGARVIDARLDDLRKRAFESGLTFDYVSDMVANGSVTGTPENPESLLAWWRTPSERYDKKAPQELLGNPGSEAKLLEAVIKDAIAR